VEPDLNQLRESLDVIDTDLVLLLAKRFRITERIGLYKRAHNLEPSDPKREAAQMARIAKLAEQNHVEPRLVLEVMRSILDEVVRNHEAVAAREYGAGGAGG
jgi:chorismate mutase